MRSTSTKLKRLFAWMERRPKLMKLYLKASQHPLWRVESGLIVAGVLLGLLSGLLSNINQARREEQLQTLFQSREVLRLSKDVKIGDLIDSNVLQPERMLLRNISPNTVTPDKLHLVLGHRFTIPLKAGDPLLLTSIQGMHEAAQMSEKIPSGKRLFTLTIADTAANHGFIHPNDHVDILAHLSLPNRGMTTFMVLQDVTLVSVGSSTVLDSKGRSNGSDVSFYVDAKDIEVLSFAQKSGSFSLSLRNPMDASRQEPGKGVDLNDFLDHDSIMRASGGGALAITSQGKDIGKK